MLDITKKKSLGKMAPPLELLHMYTGSYWHMIYFHESCIVKQTDIILWLITLPHWTSSYFLVLFTGDYHAFCLFWLQEWQNLTNRQAVALQVTQAQSIQQFSAHAFWVLTDRHGYEAALASALQSQSFGFSFVVSKTQSFDFGFSFVTLQIIAGKHLGFGFDFGFSFVLWKS